MTTPTDPRYRARDLPAWRRRPLGDAWANRAIVYWQSLSYRSIIVDDWGCRWEVDVLLRRWS